MYEDFPVPVGPTIMTALWCDTRSLKSARYRTLSKVVTKIWLGGVSLLIAGADTTSSFQGFHLPFPCKYIKNMYVFFVTF